QIAPKRRNRRRNFPAALTFAGQIEGIFLYVAEGDNSWQDHGPAAGTAQKRFNQRPPGPAGRQKDRRRTEGKRIGRIIAEGTGKQTGGERVDERSAKRDRKDAGAPRH